MEDTERIDKLLNKHRLEIVENIDVKRFLDKLRSRGVLSREDCQEMMAQQLYPTDQQRASKYSTQKN